MKIQLTDKMLAGVLSDAESDVADGSDVFQTHPQVVADIIREVQRLRVEIWGLRADERTQGAAEEISRSAVAASLRAHALRNATVTRENNALRKNNERLTRENSSMATELRASRTVNATTQAMAAYWKLKATGEPLADGEGDAEATHWRRFVACRDRYGYLSSDPTRTDAEDAEMERLRTRLLAAGVDLGLPPVPRGK